MPTALGKGCVPLEEFYSVLYHIYRSGGERLKALKALMDSMLYLGAMTTQVEKSLKIQFRQTGCQQHHFETRGSLGFREYPNKKVSSQRPANQTRITHAMVRRGKTRI